MMPPELTLTAKIDNAALDVKFDEGVTIRKIKIRLAREFDDEIAATIGGDARKALASLRSQGMEKVQMAIDRILVQAEMVSALDTVKVERLRGVQAICVAGKDADEGPTIRMQYEAMYSDDLWGFLGRNGGGIVQVTMTPVQQELGINQAAVG